MSTKKSFSDAQRAKERKKLPKPVQSSLARAGSVFVDELGKSAINKLKQKLGLNTEVHSVYVASGSGTMGTTLAAIQGAITVPQGATNYQRVGESLRVVTYEQYIRVWQDVSNTRNQVVRLICVYNRNNLPSTTPAASAILEDPVDPMSPINHEFYDQGFQLVFDEKILLSPGTSFTEGAAALYQKIWRPENVHMTWLAGDTTGVQANLTQGGIYVYALYEDLTTGIAPPRFRITSRLTFVDN